jgi:preprotein translocase subunit YajC
MVTTYTLIAEEAAPQTTQGGDQQPGGSPYGLLVMMVVIFGVFYLLLIRPQRKKEKQRQQDRETMLKNLKKSDHVMTIGGIHGVVASVTEDEVVIKVDEKNDTRLRMGRDAISRVVTEGGQSAGEGEKLGELPEAKR